MWKGQESDLEKRKKKKRIGGTKGIRKLTDSGIETLTIFFYDLTLKLVYAACRGSVSLGELHQIKKNDNS